MKTNFSIALLALAAAWPFAEAVGRTAEVFDAQNYPGAWSLATNSDSTIMATETAVHRRGDEVYSRILQLDWAAEISPTDSGAATGANIRRFINSYRPPAIPYTSEAVAKKTGQEKFNCLEFAEDLVKKANASNLSAQVIGIKFEGKLAGHAIAGFPTTDGGMLYFDSTPGAGQVSHAAHEAHVEVGKPYERAGGGELAGVGKLPISKIIPVTKLVEFASNLLDDKNSVATRKILVVVGENKIQAMGIDYASSGALQISDGQLAKWNAAAENFLKDQAGQRNHEKTTRQKIYAQAAAKALAGQKKLAANNDPYGQLRMGERYLAGDGVEKNLPQARAYLQQAADQGSPTAIQELKMLPVQTR